VELFPTVMFPPRFEVPPDPLSVREALLLLLMFSAEPETMFRAATSRVSARLTVTGLLM